MVSKDGDKLYHWRSLNGIAAFEAMAKGLPCVITDDGDSALLMGCRELLFSSRDSMSLIDQLIKILAFPTEARHQLGAQNRQRVVDKFYKMVATQ